MDRQIGTVGAPCQSGCGFITMNANHVKVLFSNDESLMPSFAVFKCAFCETTNSFPVTEDVVDALLDAGAKMMLFLPPGEMLEQHHGPPISEDDLVAFQRALESL